MRWITSSIVVWCFFPSLCMCRANYRGIGLNRFGGIFVAALVCWDNTAPISYFLQAPLSLCMSHKLENTLFDSSLEVDKNVHCTGNSKS